MDARTSSFAIAVRTGRLRPAHAVGVTGTDGAAAGFARPF